GGAGPRAEMPRGPAVSGALRARTAPPRPPRALLYRNGRDVDPARILVYRNGHGLAALVEALATPPANPHGHPPRALAVGPSRATHRARNAPSLAPGLVAV